MNEASVRTSADSARRRLIRRGAYAALVVVPVGIAWLGTLALSGLAPGDSAAADQQGLVNAPLAAAESEPDASPGTGPAAMATSGAPGASSGGAASEASSGAPGASASRSPDGPPAVLFAHGSVGLTPTARTALDALAGDLRTRPSARVRVQGHTDPGGEDHGLALRRSQATMGYLVGKGLPRTMFTVVVVGDRPVAAVTSDEWSQVVEIVVTEGN